MLSHLLHDSFFFLIIRASFYIAWILVCGIFELVLYSITFYKIVKVTSPNIPPGPSWQENLTQSGQPILIADNNRICIPFYVGGQNSCEDRKMSFDRINIKVTTFNNIYWTWLTSGK